MVSQKNFVGGTGSLFRDCGSDDAAGPGRPRPQRRGRQTGRGDSSRGSQRGKGGREGAIDRETDLLALDHALKISKA